MLALIAGILLVIAGLVIGWCALEISKLQKEIEDLRTPF
jgi:hypothetical protein